MQAPFKSVSSPLLPKRKSAPHKISHEYRQPSLSPSLNEIKEKIRSAQIKAAIAVNKELLGLYWEIGKANSKRQKSGSWGDSVIDVLSKDLSKEFPCVKGFSRTNLFYIRQWYLFYSGSDKKVQQLVGQLPWGHNIVILQKIKNKVQTSRT